ncbi:hypothetical protein K493DRAFT_301417 [Basidiobolus meristosporus CBS 931.73]|uniref:Uncharacterized protein n=1 Tax=Basidiobolus meristosporus CBS 931.73 TaxID=1314790 RepID=A0A1Y1YCC5_9FUNG|nr:hypothetical protein K493DRAFT_301417 [Basidiobolus meristosporus CBS 931.73]|eukprot:ORX95585.1 hypothetical protein K493DRAFT_301417 [Basidiobolus meristosporus CBS 931.73]
MNSTQGHLRPILTDLEIQKRIQQERDELIIQLHEANEKNLKTSEENQYLKKQHHQLHQDLIKAGDTSTHLEAQILAREQEISWLTKKNHELLRSKREAKKKLEMENEEFEIERNQWSEKVQSLNKKVKSLLSHQSRVSPQVARSRPQSNSTMPRESTQRTRSSYTPGAPGVVHLNVQATSTSKKPKSQAQSEDFKKTIRHRDTVITDLRVKLEEATEQIRRLEQRDLERNGQMTELTSERDQLKEMNLTLMEENESFQMLLHEKTISGNFSLNRGLQSPPDTLEDEEGGKNLGVNGCSTLDIELLNSAPPSPELPFTEKMVASGELKILREEIRLLREENKGLTLYINKILTRIMESGKLEELLASDYQGPESEQAIDTPEEPPAIVVTPAPLRVRSNTVVDPVTNENDPKIIRTSPSATRTRRSKTESTNSSTATGFRAAWKRMSGATWIAKPNS